MNISKATEHLFKITRKSTGNVDVVNHIDERGFRTNSRFLKLTENFLQKPALNADIASISSGPSTLAHNIANKNFEILGTNCVTTCSALSASGGVTLTTTTTANDQVIIAPHLDTDQTLWAKAGLWGTENALGYDLLFATGASVAANIIWGGFKLTNTSTVATDDDQFFFRYQATQSANFQIITSRSGTDTTTTLTHPLSVVTASTFYRIRLELDINRVPSVFINDVPVLDTKLPALTDAIDLIPYIGVQTTTTAAKAINPVQLSCERLVA